MSSVRPRERVRDIGTRLFGNLEAVARASRVVEGTFEPWGPEWREARTEGDVPVTTGAGGPIRLLTGSPVFSHVNPRVGIARSPGEVGLGLYATAPLAPGELVCLFTGVYCYEGELDEQFPFAVERFRACVHAYAMSHLPCFEASEAERGRKKINPGKGEYGLKSGTPKITMQKLVCCPRMSENVGGELSLGLCNLQYSVEPGAPLVDVGAVLNHSGRPNCTATAAVVTPANGEGEEHACLLVRVGMAGVAAGEELTLDYGRPVPPKVDARRTGAGHKFPLKGRIYNRDRRGMLATYAELEAMRTDGARAAAELAAMEPPRTLSVRMCGPAVFFFDGGDTAPGELAMVAKLDFQPNLAPLILGTDV